jgi:hypothetical protein
MAVIGFVQPDRQYRKYVIAWRLLDAKANLYKYKLLSLKQLLEGMSAAEKTIDQWERDTSLPKAGSKPLELVPPAQSTKAGNTASQRDDAVQHALAEPNAAADRPRE